MKDGVKIEFDGIWQSSLTDSTGKGKPDTELVDFSSRFATCEEILEVTTKPIIMDGDTGGKIEHFKFRVKTLERLGVSAVIIEDKIGDKRNSLFGTTVPQQQDSIENFSTKIREGKLSQLNTDFMIVASGNSSRHIQALSEILLENLKKQGINSCSLEGRDSQEWKLIDATDIIVHIFHPEKRKFYNLENMWSELIPKERVSL